MQFNKSLYKKIIPVFIILFFSCYFIFFIFLINDGKRKIKESEVYIKKIEKSIFSEISNRERIEKYGKDFLKTAYFDRKEKFFENYIRGLFGKYNIKIKIYQSSINTGESAELDLAFEADAFKLFKLVKEMEEGEKIIVIKNFTIVKDRLPVLKVSMRLNGFYKE